MGLSKKYCNASSLLESVIALTIISICLYIAVLVFATVFNNRTSVRFYTTQNCGNEFFFLSQTASDSLAEVSGLQYETESFSEGFQKISIQYQDSTKTNFESNFYIPAQ